MDIRYSEEQGMLRDSARRFLEEHCRFDPDARARSVGAAQRELWSRCAQLGIAGLTIPESFGGFGGTAVDRSIVMEEIGRRLAVIPFLSSAVLSATLLARAKPACHLLSGLATGTVQVALADQEAAGALEPEAIACRAKALADEVAPARHLYGQKVAVLGGPTADWFIVSALNAEDGTLGLYLVPAGTPGLSVRSHAAIDGSSIAELRLDGVACPDDAHLLSGDAALSALEDCRDQALIALGSEAVGLCEAVLDTTREYLSVRKQFGQPLATFQALQHRMAEMYVETQKLRGQVLAALASLGGPVTEQRRMASAVKVQIGEAGLFVARQGIQLHGGMGMTNEYVIGHYFKRMTVIDMLFGTSSQHLQRFMALSRGNEGETQ